jgi:gentisate 1,2-dioxygenase
MSQTQRADETKELEEFKAKHPNQGMHFKNLKTFPVHYRALRNTAGAHFELSDNKTVECHISEIAPGSHNKKHRHMNEAIIYILTGRGHSILSDDAGHATRIDWEEGDIFSPPLNWWHQHFNDDPAKPARYLAFTNIGLMTRLGLFSKESAKEDE